MTEKILVVNGTSYGRVAKGFGDIVYNIDHFMKNPEEYKLILFTGGADISPQLYGDTSPFGWCYNNIKRDIQEIKIFKMAVKHKIVMTGICRGLQFLNVMAGGKMIHHLEKHAGTSGHNMMTNNDNIIRINSLHHQMILPPPDAVILGWAYPSISNVYIGQNDKNITMANMKEYEAAIFPRIKAFGVQYHPEMMETISDGYLWYKAMIHMALNVSWKDFVQRYDNGENTEILKHNSKTAR